MVRASAAQHPSSFPLVAQDPVNLIHLRHALGRTILANIFAQHFPNTLALEAP